MRNIGPQLAACLLDLECEILGILPQPRWFYSLNRPNSAMIGEPPSSRPMWYDPEARR